MGAFAEGNSAPLKQCRPAAAMNATLPEKLNCGHPIHVLLLKKDVRKPRLIL